MMGCTTRIRSIITAVWVFAAAGVLFSHVAVHGMSLEEARAMVKAAHDANKAGDHSEAIRLAKKVLGEAGDVVVYWPGEGAKHPAPEADIQNPEAFVRAQREAARDTGAEVEIHISGASARGELLDGYYGSRDWEATATLAADLLAEHPDADVAWLHLRIARKHLAAKNPSLPYALAVKSAARYHVISATTFDQGAIWMKLRSLALAPGAGVAWEAESRTATLTLDGRQLCFRPGSREVIADGTRITCPHAAQVKDGRIWLSVDCLKAMGFWSQGDPEAKLIRIGLG